MHLLRWKKSPVLNSISHVRDFARAFLTFRNESQTIGRILGVFTVWITNPEGQIVVPKSEGINTLTIEGANLIRDLLYKNHAAVGTDVTRLGLFLDSATPSTSSTLASGPTGEASGNGYGRVQITAANWSAASNGSVNNTAAPAVFTAVTGNLGGGAVNEVFACDSNTTTGHLYSYASPTGAPFTVPAGSSLNATYTWTVS